jgi:predicted metal-binding protein
MSANAGSRLTAARRHRPHRDGIAPIDGTPQAIVASILAQLPQLIDRAG